MTSYLIEWYLIQDPANIQSKHQKHQAFEAELAANAERIQSVLAMGGNLVQRGQCSGSEDAVQVKQYNYQNAPVICDLYIYNIDY